MFLCERNFSSQCPLPPWLGRTIMFLCERICRHDVPYHPGRVVLLCSCAREFVVTMSLTTLAGSYYYVLVRENFSPQCPLPPWLVRTIMFLCENLSSRCPLSPWPGRTTMFLCERICLHDVPYHPGRVVQLCSCAREFFVTMSLITLAWSYNYVLVRDNFLSQCPLPHPQIYLNCHLEKIQSYLNIHVIS